MSSVRRNLQAKTVYCKIDTASPQRPSNNTTSYTYDCQLYCRKVSERCCHLRKTQSLRVFRPVLKYFVQSSADGADNKKPSCTIRDCVRLESIPASGQLGNRNGVRSWKNSLPRVHAEVHVTRLTWRQNFVHRDKAAETGHCVLRVATNNINTNDNRCFHISECYNPDRQGT